MLRKTIVSLLLLFLVIGVLSPNDRTAAASSSITITGDSVNVREGPGLTYNVIGQVKKGQKFSLLSEKKDWVQIKLSNGKKGWIANWLVSKNKPTNPPNKPLGEKTGTITASSLNVRSNPSTTSSIIGTLQNGAKITVISQANGWTQIRFNGKTAWVSSDFVKLDGVNKPEPPKTPTPPSGNKGVVGTITADLLNVRNSGSLNGKLIGTVSKGQQFVILAEVNSWIKIEFKSKKYGWVSSLYVNKNKTNPTNPPTTNDNSVKGSSVSILENGTNIRKGPGTNFDVVKVANAGERYAIVSLNNNWYEIKMPSGGTAYVAGWLVSVIGSAPDVTKPGSQKGLIGKTIVLDPGHGGIDNGTTGAQGSLEKIYTLRSAMLLKSKLQAAGAKVILTRSDNQTYVSLSERVSISHAYSADAFISLHYDSTVDRSANGLTTYYYHNYQKALADSIHSALMNQVKIYNRGVRFGDFHVIRENRQKSVLIELGFLSNPSEERLITSDSYQNAAMTGIVNGLAQYFSK